MLSIFETLFVDPLAAQSDAETHTETQTQTQTHIVCIVSLRARSHFDTERMSTEWQLRLKGVRECLAKNMATQD